MKERITSFLKSDFFFSSLYSGIATFIRICTAFLLSKIIAQYLGAEGLGIIGQLSNLVTIVLMIAGGAVNTGVTKYIAEFTVTNTQKLRQFVSTSCWFVLIMTFITSVLLALTAPVLSKKILHNSSYNSVFYAFACTLGMYSLNGFLFAVINGRKKFRLYNLLNVTGSIINLLVSFLLIHFYNLKGALFGIVLQQSFVFLVTVYIVKKRKLFSLNNLLSGIHKSDLLLLSKFILITIAANVFLPLSQLFIRNRIIEAISLKGAGLWETVNRISSMHLLFFITSISTYYLPRLSEIQDKRLLKFEMVKTFKIFFPIVCFTALLIYLLRSLVVRILFTTEFAAAESLFSWQMAGDVLKVITLIFSYQMLAKAMVITYIVTEFISAAIFYTLSIFFLPTYGIEGVSIAYAFSYLIYLLIALIIFRNYFST